MKAYLKNYKQSPRKVRLMADLIRGEKVGRALMLLSAMNKRAAGPLKKLIESAVSNAKASEDKNNLIIKEIQVNKGIVFKRFQPRARGRAALIRKKTSHISIVLGEQSKKVRSAKTKNQNDKLKSKNEIKLKSVKS